MHTYVLQFPKEVYEIIFIAALFIITPNAFQNQT